VAWAEQRVASGIAAVLVASSAIFVLLLDGRARRRSAALVGVALGMTGILVMAAPWQARGAADLAGVAALLGAALLWAGGSAWSPGPSVSGSTLMNAGLELLAGSALTLVVGLVLGEAGQVHLDAVTARSLLALGYLILFGSVVAYTAFRWLLKVSSPTLVATHAYVNPVVALALGWQLNGEALTGSMVAAAALVLGGVALVASPPH
jgi:drug/metabolite transporter (DMT)-like permease